MSKCLVDESRLTDAGGRCLTQALFYESSNGTREKYTPIYTFKLRDYEVAGIGKMISAYKVYMDAIDEYDAAVKLVGNLHHWEMLCASKWFMEGGIFPAVSHLGLKTWREHKAAKERSIYLSILQEKAKDNDTTAAKAVLAEMKNEQVVAKRARGKQNKEVDVMSEEANDFLRLRRVK